MIHAGTIHRGQRNSSPGELPVPPLNGPLTDASGDQRGWGGRERRAPRLPATTAGTSIAYRSLRFSGIALTSSAPAQTRPRRRAPDGRASLSHSETPSTWSEPVRGGCERGRDEREAESRCASSAWTDAADRTNTHKNSKEIFWYLTAAMLIYLGCFSAAQLRFAAVQIFFYYYYYYCVVSIPALALKSLPTLTATRDDPTGMRKRKRKRKSHAGSPGGQDVHTQTLPMVAEWGGGAGARW